MKWERRGERESGEREREGKDCRGGSTHFSKASSRGRLNLISLTKVRVVCVEYTSREASPRNHLIVLIQPEKCIEKSNDK